MRLRPLRWLCLTLLMTACAAPTMELYTLGAPAVAAEAVGNLAETPTVEVRRVVLPDYLDNQDIVIRRGSSIERSSTGRWASRLSIGATDLITARLSASRTDLFVTDQPVSTAARFRLFVNISRLDVSADGTGALAADWSIVPSRATQPQLRARATFSAKGPVKSDADVVALTDRLLEELAVKIGQDMARAVLAAS
jgi:uncharacterized lipoprotein YmbA